MTQGRRSASPAGWACYAPWARSQGRSTMTSHPASSRRTKQNRAPSCGVTFQVMARAALKMTFRGRDAELHQLRSAVDRARSGSLTIALVDGEAGIGKTRLLAEALQYARTSGYQVAAAKAEEMEQARPFGVVAEALGCVRSATDPRRAAIAALLATHHTGDRGPLTVSSDPGLRFRAVDAFGDLVEGLALQGPLVVGIDDLQWADPSSLVTLSTLARTAVGLPVALIGCYRPFPQPPALRSMLESFDEAATRRLQLRHLDDRAVYRVVAEAVGAEPGSGLLAEIAGAAGNPLFVTELLNAIAQEGRLRTTEGRAEVTEPTLPPSLRLTILRRLSSLPDDTLQVLRTGSLLGSSFSSTELAAVMARPVAELTTGIEAGIAAGVLEEDELQLRFRHDLIRDAVYADMPPSLRFGLHRETAQRLASIGAPATQVAEQFTRGAQPGDDDAIAWLTKAAREAASSSPETGADLLQRAVKLMTPTDPRSDVLLAERADCLMLAGRVTDAIAACRSLLARGHRPDADAPARIRLGAALLVNGQPTEALTELDTVAQSAGSTEAQRTSSLGEASTAKLWLGDFDGAASAAEQARLAALHTGDHRTAVEALATQSIVACVHGQTAQAVKTSDQAIDLADDSPDRSGHGYPVYATRAWIMIEFDRLAEAREALAAGRRRCEELGVRWPLATYQAYLAVERFTAGEWNDAETELEAGVELAEETGVTFALKPSHSAQALIRLHRGDLAGAQRAIDNAVALAGRGSRLFDYRAAWARALLLEAKGDTTQAFTTLSDRWRVCHGVGMAVDYPVVGPDLVRLARTIGDTDLAEEVATAVREAASGNQVPSFTGAALRCRGLLTDDAETMTRALDAYADSPRRLELALVCEETAAIATRKGDAAHARSLLQRAGGIFEQLDATRDLARINAALRELGVRRGRKGPRRRPRSGWSSLTTTEHTIADLVAEGLSNPQIAARLYISRRTVQTHVSHIFTKLDIASRTQLAAAVTQHRHPGQNHAEAAYGRSNNG